MRQPDEKPMTGSQAAKRRRAPRVEADRDPIETWLVVVECRDEAEQRTVYECLTADGHRCRVMVL
jgi:hypothetical protein